jgi:hypothetical protein
MTNRRHYPPSAIRLGCACPKPGPHMAVYDRLPLAVRHHLAHVTAFNYCPLRVAELVHQIGATEALEAMVAEDAFLWACVESEFSGVPA